MNEDYVCRSSLISGLMWVLVGVMLGMTTGLGLSSVPIGQDALIVLSTATLCATSIACALQVRTYAIRVATLVRVSAGLEDVGPGLRAIP